MSGRSAVLIHQLLGAAAALQGGGLHLLLQLLEGPDLDLPYPLAADAVVLAQILERGRVVAEPALDQDVAFALVQPLDRLAQQLAALAQLLLIGKAGLLV